MAALLGAAPAAVLLALMTIGALEPGHGLAALLTCSLAALGLAWIWLRGVGRLAALLHRAAAEEGPFSPPMPVPRLPGLGGIEQGLAQLTRSLQARAALVGRLRAADATILEALPDPLLVLAADAAPLRANQAARRLFGLPEQGVAGGDLGALLRHPALAAALDRVLAGRGAQSVELHLPGPQQRDLSAQVIAMEPPLADGGRLLVVLADRSAVRAMERMRVDFVTNASHELRTPLASLMGFIETLRGPAPNDLPGRRGALFPLGFMASRAGERMRRLIDDLLGLSARPGHRGTCAPGDAELCLLRAEARRWSPLPSPGAPAAVADWAGALWGPPRPTPTRWRRWRATGLDNALRHAAATWCCRRGGGAGRARGGVVRGADDGPAWRASTCRA
jgi:two-component system phosphate regulon sensor histidine kinase PhoR